MDGIINVHKPKGITSYDVIRFIKRTFHPTEKIGHAGTLDPLAEGVLLVCLGRTTKLSAMLMDKEKEYVAQLQLGVTTDTLDLGGKVLEEKDVRVTPEEVEAAIRSFEGEIVQIPPVVSALKHEGQPMYKLFRKGVAVAPEPRKVMVKKIEVLKINLPYAEFRVVCSKGTYVRALCRDIGERLGCGGVQTALLRTRVGAFALADAVTLEEMEAKGLKSVLIPLTMVLTMLKQ